MKCVSTLFCRSSSESSHPRRELPRSRLSDRPQSSQSSGVGSAIVDGCGGRCQTFENVCYYFLQVSFYILSYAKLRDECMV